jgi:hypothetical protein
MTNMKWIPEKSLPQAVCAGWWLAWALLVLVTAGCGKDSGPGRFDVSGKITFDGKPIPGGQIVFEPDTAAGNRGPAGVALIVDGQFDTARNGKGTVGGAHIARITGLDSQPGPGASPKPLFNPYEVKVDLGKSKTAKDIDVPASAAKGLAPPGPPV